MMTHKRILLVDDEADILEELCELFEMLDLETTCARSVDSALQAVRDDTDITLIVTDVRMPGRDGIDLVRELAADSHRDFEFIVISGHFDSDSEMVGLSRLPVTRLRKPINVEEMATLLEQLKFEA